jgi:hypothetical protein
VTIDDDRVLPRSGPEAGRDFRTTRPSVPYKEPPYSFAFAYSPSSELCTCTIAPFAEEMHRCLEFSQWSDCLTAFGSSALEARADQDLREAWSGKAHLGLPFFSRAQLAYIANCLENEGLSLADFDVRLNNGELRVTVSSHNYHLSLRRRFGRKNGYTGEYTPAAKALEGRIDTEDWPAAQTRIAEWATQLAFELFPRTGPLGQASLVTESVGERDEEPFRLLLGLRLEHVRRFRSLQLDLSDGAGNPRMQTILIGANGTCKTTLLRCLALALCPAQ